MLVAFFTLASLLQTGELSSPSNSFEIRGSVDLRWRDAREIGSRYSGLEGAGRLGIFRPDQSPFVAGFEISTFNDHSNDDTRFISLSAVSSSRSLDISQLFFGFQMTGNLQLELLAGKLPASNEYSPLISDLEWNKAGAKQKLTWQRSESRWSVSLFADQIALSQVADSALHQTSFTRDWMFIQGASLETVFPDISLRIRFGGTHSHILNVPNALKSKSAATGNSFSGSLDNPILGAKFSTSEAILELTALPLGLTTKLKTAFAINWRSSDLHRGFFVEGTVGNSWIKENLLGSLSYYYAEPDLTLASIADPHFSFTNREVFRGAISYFPLDDLKAELTVLYARAIAASSLQNTKKEIIFLGSLRF